MLGVENTRESEGRPTGVELCGVGFQPAIDRQDAYPTLQFGRFDFGDESQVIVGEERKRSLNWEARSVKNSDELNFRAFKLLNSNFTLLTSHF